MIQPHETQDPRELLRWAAAEIDTMTQFLVADTAEKDVIVTLCYTLRSNVLGVVEEMTQWLALHPHDTQGPCPNCGTEWTPTKKPPSRPVENCEREYCCLPKGHAGEHDDIPF